MVIVIETNLLMLQQQFQGGKVKKTFTIPYLVGMKRRMASVLVLSNSTDQEKAIMIHSECELDTTRAGGIA
jgi:hypothetical protein